MNAPRRYLITGTDTEIGKTVTSCGLIRLATRQGFRCCGLKPISAGCHRTDEGLRNDDALALMASANVELPYDTVNPWAFEPPISPHLALASSGQTTLDTSRIRHSLDKAVRHCDWVLVEGFGGWHAPMDAERSFADLAAELALPVILVVGLRLGCLNHAMLSSRAILADGLSLAGWVGNCIDPDMQAMRGNIDWLQQKIPAPCLGIIKHGSTDPSLVADQLRLPD